MSSRERWSRSCAASRTLLAAALLVGLVAMTWLAPHRVAHAEGVAALPHSATAAHQGGGHPDDAATHDRAHDRALEAHDEDDHSHVLDVMLGFLMTLVGAALLLVWARRPHRAMALVRRVRSRVRRTGRPPDPPCLHRLSILIC